MKRVDNVTAMMVQDGMTGAGTIGARVINEIARGLRKNHEEIEIDQIDSGIRRDFS